MVLKRKRSQKNIDVANKKAKVVDYEQFDSGYKIMTELQGESALEKFNDLVRCWYSLDLEDEEKQSIMQESFRLYAKLTGCKELAGFYERCIEDQLTNLNELSELQLLLLESFALLYERCPVDLKLYSLNSKISKSAARILKYLFQGNTVILDLWCGLLKNEASRAEEIYKALSTSMNVMKTILSSDNKGRHEFIKLWTLLIANLSVKSRTEILDLNKNIISLIMKKLENEPEELVLSVYDGIFRIVIDDRRIQKVVKVTLITNNMNFLLKLVNKYEFAYEFLKGCVSGLASKQINTSIAKHSRPIGNDRELNLLIAAINNDFELCHDFYSFNPAFQTVLKYLNDPSSEDDWLAAAQVLTKILVEYFTVSTDSINSIIPKALSRQLFSKCLQSGGSWVKLGTLFYLSTLCDKFETLCQNKNYTDLVNRRLPDAQVLIRMLFEKGLEKDSKNHITKLLSCITKYSQSPIKLDPMKVYTTLMQEQLDIKEGIKLIKSIVVNGGASKDLTLVTHVIQHLDSFAEDENLRKDFLSFLLSSHIPEMKNEEAEIHADELSVNPTSRKFYLECVQDLKNRVFEYYDAIAEMVGSSSVEYPCSILLLALSRKCCNLPESNTMLVRVVIRCLAELDGLFSYKDFFARGSETIAQITVSACKSEFLKYGLEDFYVSFLTKLLVTDPECLEDSAIRSFLFDEVPEQTLYKVASQLFLTNKKFSKLFLERLESIGSTTKDRLVEAMNAAVENALSSGRHVDIEQLHYPYIFDCKSETVVAYLKEHVHEVYKNIGDNLELLSFCIRENIAVPLSVDENGSLGGFCNLLVTSNTIIFEKGDDLLPLLELLKNHKLNFNGILIGESQFAEYLLQMAPKTDYLMQSDLLSDYLLNCKAQIYEAFVPAWLASSQDCSYPLYESYLSILERNQICDQNIANICITFLHHGLDQAKASNTPLALTAVPRMLLGRCKEDDFDNCNTGDISSLFVKILKAHLSDEECMNTVVDFYDKFPTVATNAISPLKLFGMILAHSKFSEFMENGEAACRGNIMKLLRTLLMLEHNESSIENAKKLVELYYEGTDSDADQHLEAVMHFIEKETEKSVVPLIKPKFSIQSQLFDGKQLMNSLYDFDVISGRSRKEGKQLSFNFWLSILCVEVMTMNKDTNLQTIIDNNGLSLAFVAISCKNPEIRSKGYLVLEKICSTFDDACVWDNLNEEQTKYENFRHKSFSLVRSVKEKRQVYLLLVSLRNAITEENQRISFVMALFLSQAIHILQNPSSNLYTLVNKYLLRSSSLDLEDIPMFYDSFNSTDSDEWRNHKIFALKLLKHGLHDEEFAINLAQRKYVPDILISEFPVADSQMKSYIVEIFETLTIVVMKYFKEDQKSYNYFTLSSGLIPFLSYAKEETDVTKIVKILNDNKVLLAN